MAKNIKTRQTIRRPWTKQDVRELKTHAKQKTPVKAISRRMARTQGALRQKAFAEGLSLGHREYRKS